MGHKKTIQKLKIGSKNITYQELAELLKALGYEENNKGRTSGLRVKFWNAENGKMVYLHKPHPRKTLLQYQIRDVLEVIRDEING